MSPLFRIEWLERVKTQYSVFLGPVSLCLSNKFAQRQGQLYIAPGHVVGRLVRKGGVRTCVSVPRQQIPPETVLRHRDRDKFILSPEVVEDININKSKQVCYCNLCPV